MKCPNTENVKNVKKAIENFQKFTSREKLQKHFTKMLSENKKWFSIEQYFTLEHLADLNLNNCTYEELIAPLGALDINFPAADWRGNPDKVMYCKYLNEINDAYFQLKCDSKRKQKGQKE